MTEVILDECVVIDSWKGARMDIEAATRRLGRRLAELREPTDMSQADVDRHFGWKNGRTYRIESGNKEKLPSPAELRQLAKLYGTSVEKDLMVAAGYTDDDVPQSETPQIPTVDRRRRQPAESH